MYIQGTQIEKRCKGSLESKVSAIHEAIAGHFEEPVSILATHDKHCYVMDDCNGIFKVGYKIENGEVTDIKPKATKDIEIIEDSDVPQFVSRSLRQMVEMVIEGKEISRTQVREVSQMIDGKEDYWVSDIIGKMDEATGDSQWFDMYEANQDKIRTSLWGSIKEMEKPFPSTKFSQIAKSKLSKFEDELREAINIIAKHLKTVVDECGELVFNEDQDEFYSAICESLIVEAQAIGGLLSKAEKLMQSDDIGRMAVAHDRLAERAKVMAVVTGYLKKKAQRNNNEE